MHRRGSAICETEERREAVGELHDSDSGNETGDGLDLGDRGLNNKGCAGMAGMVYSTCWLPDNSPRLQYKQTKTLKRGNR